MIPSELQQVETLLLQALPDPRGFAGRVMEQLLDRLVNESPGERPVAVAQATTHDGGDLSVVLAGALGACECWGDDPDCSSCSGVGSAGWMQPDEGLYAEYVAPAVRRMADTATAPFTDDQPTSAARHLGVGQ
jgi:hypothetical protein